MPKTLIKISRGSWHGRLYIWHENLFPGEYPYQDIIHYMAVIMVGVPFQFFIWQPIKKRNWRYAALGQIVFLAAFLFLVFQVGLPGTFSILCGILFFIFVSASVNLGFVHKFRFLSQVANKRHAVTPRIEIVA